VSEEFFFNGWSGLLRVVLVGVLAYLALIAVLRISGKRTLSKMNAFDFVVTVALGSTLATIILSKDVALVEGVLALALLIGLQYAITWLSVRSSTVSNLVKAEPSLLLYQGRLLADTLRRERVTEDEVRAAARASGQAVLDDLLAIVLETDGTFTVVPQTDQRPTALADMIDNRTNARAPAARMPGRSSR
jgi:uncharacterized membrane protein YcaP (DUF421 family)